MDDGQEGFIDPFWIVATVGFLALVTLILLFGFPQNPADYKVASENVTGPPPMLNLPPAWTVPIAGVVALTIGLIAAQSETTE